MHSVARRHLDLEVFETGMTGKEAGWVHGGTNSLENDVYIKGVRGFLASRGGHFY